MQKKRRPNKLQVVVEESFRELEDSIPDNSITQELVIGDEETTLEMDPVVDLRDEYDWLAQPVDDWQRRVISEDVSQIDWFVTATTLSKLWTTSDGAMQRKEDESKHHVAVENPPR